VISPVERPQVRARLATAGERIEDAPRLCPGFDMNVRLARRRTAGCVRVRRRGHERHLLPGILGGVHSKDKEG
jgi:hypothetical protein